MTDKQMKPKEITLTLKHIRQSDLMTKLNVDVWLDNDWVIEKIWWIGNPRLVLENYLSPKGYKGLRRTHDSQAENT